MKTGDVLRVKYPFVRCEVDVPSDEGQGFATIKSWRPGVEFEQDDNGDTDSVCHGEGEMILTVVDVHKPGRFPSRVFFTRQWVSPDGHAFGKGNLHIMTQQALKRRARGYMHEYILVEDAAKAAQATGTPPASPENTK